MSQIKFNNNFGTMDLETRIRSIFDTNIAGQIAEDGNYYCIHVDHKTHKKYALSKEAELLAYSLGNSLSEGQKAIFNGENVRAMTLKEEMLFNEDKLTAHVDLWGNIATEEKFDMDYYMEH